MAAARAGSCTFTQYESGKTAGVGLSQSAGEITSRYVISADRSFQVWDGSERPVNRPCNFTITSEYRTYINGRLQSSVPDRNWSWVLNGKDKDSFACISMNENTLQAAPRYTPGQYMKVANIQLASKDGEIYNIGLQQLADS